MKLYSQKLRPGIYSNITFYAAREAYFNMGFDIEEIESPDELEHIEQDHLFLGTIQFMQTALRKLGIEVPPPLDYPESLKAFWGRSITESTMNEIAADPNQWNVFVKPKGYTKKFTGRLIRSTKDLVGCGDTEMNTPVWVSEPVTFVAEWRVFVRYKTILDVRPYKGDWKAPFDPEIITAAVEAYTDQPAAYALDFGRTTDDRFLLVEANDGYSLRSYGLFYINYAKLLSARWAELTGQTDLCLF